MLLVLFHTADVLFRLTNPLPFPSLSVDFINENFRSVRYAIICQCIVGIVKLGWKRIALWKRWCLEDAKVRPIVYRQQQMIKTRKQSNAHLISEM